MPENAETVRHDRARREGEGEGGRGESLGADFGAPGDFKREASALSLFLSLAIGRAERKFTRGLLR